MTSTVVLVSTGLRSHRKRDAPGQHLELLSEQRTFSHIGGQSAEDIQPAGAQHNATGRDETQGRLLELNQALSSSSEALHQPALCSNTSNQVIPINVWPLFPKLPFRFILCSQPVKILPVHVPAVSFSLQ